MQYHTFKEFLHLQSGFHEKNKSWPEEMNVKIWTSRGPPAPQPVATLQNSQPVCHRRGSESLN